MRRTASPWRHSFFSSSLQRMPSGAGLRHASNSFFASSRTLSGVRPAAHVLMAAAAASASAAFSTYDAANAHPPVGAELLLEAGGDVVAGAVALVGEILAAVALVEDALAVGVIDAADAARRPSRRRRDRSRRSPSGRRPPRASTRRSRPGSRRPSPMWKLKSA